MGKKGIILTAALLLAASPVATALAQNFDSFAPGNRQALRFDERSHASSRENVKMLRLAHDDPDRFTGKMLMLSDGRKAGNILSVQRNRDDKLLYLVIQAAPYFKEDVMFAVPVLDVDRIQGHLVILSTLPGNFLRGVEYEIANFQGINTYEDWPLVVDQ